MSALRTSTRLLALACDTLRSQQRSVCQITCAAIRSLSSNVFEPHSSLKDEVSRQQARGFAAGPEVPADDVAVRPGSSILDPPSPRSSESYQAAGDTSSSESDVEDAEDDETDEFDDDSTETWQQEQALLQSTQAEGGPEDAQPSQAEDSPEDDLLEKLQSSSKKHQRHMLQQLLRGSELTGHDSLNQQEEGAATIAAARQKYSLKLVDVNSTNKGSPAGGIQSFSAMVVVGDCEGSLGHGTGKAAELVSAIRKASLRALNNMTYVPRYERFTILHPVDTKYGKCKLRMYPLASGGGIRANALLGDIASLAGIKAIGIKTHGTRNARNSVKALFQAFEQLTTVEQQAKEKGMAALEVILGSRPKPKKQRFK